MEKILSQFRMGSWKLFLGIIAALYIGYRWGKSTTKETNVFAPVPQKNNDTAEEKTVETEPKADKKENVETTK